MMTSTNDTFVSHFYSEFNKILERLNALKNEPLNENESDVEKKQRLSSDYEKISKQTEILQSYFTDNSKFITQYEIRKAQEHLTKLNKQSQEKREELFPKKKFGFKSKQNMTTLAAAIETASTECKKEVNRSGDDTADYALYTNLQNTCTIKDLNKEEKIFVGNEIDDKDILIVNIKDSFIQLIGKPSVVQIKSVENSTILCGPVNGSAFIDKCKNCKIVMACHQLRIHESHFVDFYIHVGSRAIIEYCKDVKFAPYSWSFSNVDNYFQKAGFDYKKISWQSIDDFNWLVTNQQSPNWNFLDESKRIKWTSDENGKVTEQK